MSNTGVILVVFGLAGVCVVLSSAGAGGWYYYDKKHKTTPTTSTTSTTSSTTTTPKTETTTGPANTTNTSTPPPALGAANTTTTSSPPAPGAATTTNTSPPPAPASNPAPPPVPVPNPAPPPPPPVYVPPPLPNCKATSARLVGVGMGDELFTKTSLAANWTQPWNTCCVRDIYALNSSTYFGVGTDGNIYERPGGLNGSFKLHASAGRINLTRVVVVHSSLAYGITPDNKLVLWGSAAGVWPFADLNPVTADTGATTNIVALDRPTFNKRWHSVRTDGKVYHKEGELWSEIGWTLVPGQTSGVQLQDVKVFSDGSMLGVGTNNFVYYKVNDSSDWVLHSDGLLKAIDEAL